MSEDDLEPSRQPPVPGQRRWALGLAAGVAVLLVGAAVSTPVLVAGAVVAVASGLLWLGSAARGSGLAEAGPVEPERRDGPAPGRVASPPTLGRSAFLELSTLGLGGVIGGLVTVPAFAFMIAPAFLKQRESPHDLGPVSDFPEGEFVVATFMGRPEQGEVSRRTAFVRNNGTVDGQPSFTIISNHCAHLGCPVQPNTDLNVPHRQYRDVTLIPLPITPAGFGCPCHGGQYDTEGNRIAGPPVRALDRYSFFVRDRHLYLGAPYSVSHVVGTGATARIYKYPFSFPGEHVDGPESWLYPIQPPH